MQNLWNSEKARTHAESPLAERAYSAQLIHKAEPFLAGRSSFASVKFTAENVFGERENQLWIAPIDSSNTPLSADAFLGLQADNLRKWIEQGYRNGSSAEDALRVATLTERNQAAPLDALIHAILPFHFIDQTCSLAIWAISNLADCEAASKAAFGDRVAVASYSPPGRDRAQMLLKRIDGQDLSQIDGILIPQVGLLTFHETAQGCYERTLSLAQQAADYLDAPPAPEPSRSEPPKTDLLQLADIRRVVSKNRGYATIAAHIASPAAVALSLQSHPEEILGSECPVFDGETELLEETHSEYRHLAWKGQGLLNFGPDKTKASDLALQAQRAAEAFQLAQQQSEWKAHPREDATNDNSPTESSLPLRGKIALVTGSAAGIGQATATTLAEAGACVIGADINPEVVEAMEAIDGMGVVIDLTQEDAIQAMIEQVIQTFGGLDILISNAGIFTAGAYIQDMDPKNWDRSLLINLTSHQTLLKHAIPYLKKGVDPSIILVGSRNVNAPGAGAASYSCAKAALTQLCRVAALELAPDGVRVNIIHPDAVFDTKLWTPEALQRSAERYGITVEQYKKRNLMKTEITSRSVGNTVVALVSDAFAKTTGAQIPIDGGNDRII